MQNRIFGQIFGIIVSGLGCVGVWRVNIVTSTSHMHQPSTMWGRTGGVWVCGGLILSLQYHICINRQLCGVELGGVEGEYRHFNITYASTVNYVGSNWGCVGVWRVNTVTFTSHMHQPSTMWGRTGGGGCVEGEYCHFNITYASTVNYVGSNWGCMGV